MHKIATFLGPGTFHSVSNAAGNGAADKYSRLSGIWSLQVVEAGGNNPSAYADGAGAGGGGFREVRKS